MKNWIVVVFSFLAFQSFGQDFKLIRTNLEKFVDSSIEVREIVMPTIGEYGYASYQMDSLNHLIQFRDSIHLKYVILILEEHGWLGTSVIGKKGNISIFLAVQHAPNPLTRERYFPMLEASALRGESTISQMATMKDRILIQNKTPQIYGTQWNLVDDQQVLYPVENSKEVNSKRESVGLKSLSEESIKSAQTKFQ